jgi:hypothetical protein
MKEPSFPVYEGQTFVIEDEIIPLLPDLPGPQDKEFHEKEI